MRFAIPSLVLSFVLAPAANAALIQYDFTGDGNGSTLLGSSGYWRFNDTDVTQGASLTDKLQAWSVSWSTTAGNFALDSTTANLVSNAFQLEGSSTNMESVSFCVSASGSACVPASHPVFAIAFVLGHPSSGWAGSLSPSFSDVSLNTLTVSGPNTVSVPEPGTLLLLSSALAGMAVIRRRRQQAA